MSAKCENPLKYILNVLYHNPAIIWVSKRSIEAQVMPGLWQTVCKKIEPDEKSAEACRRETLEETGISLSLNRIKKVFNDSQFNCDVYITKLRDEETPRWTEADKARPWKVIGQKKYFEWTGKRIMTPTHVNHCIKIIKALYEDSMKSSIDPLEEHEYVYKYNEIDK